MSSSSNRPFIIFGASGHGKVIADILEKSGIKIAGFIDDDPQKTGTSFFGYSIWSESDFKKKLGFSDYFFIAAIGNNTMRKNVVERLRSAGARFGKAVHPAAVIGRDVKIEQGTVIMANCVINPGTCIGEHCIVNTCTSIDHDNRIGDYVHLSPGVRLGGGVSIETGSWVGIGATVLNNLKVGSGTLVGGGAVVIRDVESETVVVGNPARFLRKTE